jgi:hypothetical protein
VLRKEEEAVEVYLISIANRKRKTNTKINGIKRK